VEKCEKVVHQKLKYSETVLPNGEMRHQILKIWWNLKHLVTKKEVWNYTRRKPDEISWYFAVYEKTFLFQTKSSQLFLFKHWIWQICLQSLPSPQTSLVQPACKVWSRGDRSHFFDSCSCSKKM